MSYDKLNNANINAEISYRLKTSKKPFASYVNWAFDLYDIMKRYGIVRVSNGDGDSCDFNFIPFDGMNYRPIHVMAATESRAICEGFLIWHDQYGVEE